ELLSAFKEEEEFWRQQSKIMWLAVGDKNLRYFHAVCKGKRVCNRIYVLESSLGHPMYEQELIAQEITNYYQSLFTAKSYMENSFTLTDIVDQAISSCKSDEVNEKLTTIPSLAEIRDTMFSINPDKAPGLDGFS